MRETKSIALRPSRICAISCVRPALPKTEAPPGRLGAYQLRHAPTGRPEPEPRQRGSLTMHVLKKHEHRMWQLFREAFALEIERPK